MRYIVLDTNVIISALIFGGNPETVLQYILARQSLAASPAIQREIARVLLNKFVWSQERVDRAFARLWENAHIVYPPESLSIIVQDASDNRILECAIAANAEAIVSGDRDLLKLDEFQSIRILSPAEFLTAYIS